MNRKGHETLQKIFQDPPATDLQWVEIQDLLKRLAKEHGGTYSDGSEAGARILIWLNNCMGVFEYPQRPNVGTIKDLRDFLEKARIAP